MDKVKSMVLEKMDLCYSSKGLSSQKSTSCEASKKEQISFNTCGSFACMIMIAPLLDKNMFTKTTTNSIKLSIHVFQKKLREKGSKTWGIGRLNDTFVRKRSTLFSKDT